VKLTTTETKGQGKKHVQEASGRWTMTMQCDFDTRKVAHATNSEEATIGDELCSLRCT